MIRMEELEKELKIQELEFKLEGAKSLPKIACAVFFGMFFWELHNEPDQVRALQILGGASLVCAFITFVGIILEILYFIKLQEFKK